METLFDGYSPYNYHCMANHLLEDRVRHGGCLNYSSLPFESLYGSTKRLYTAGTHNIGLQMFRNTLLNNLSHRHMCRADYELK